VFVDGSDLGAVRGDQDPLAVGPEAGRQKGWMQLRPEKEPDGSRGGSARDGGG